MHKLALINTHEKGLLNVNQAGAKLGVSPKTIRKWQHEGKLLYVKIFGAVRFDINDLNMLIEKSKIRKELL